MGRGNSRSLNAAGTFRRAFSEDDALRSCGIVPPVLRPRMPPVPVPASNAAAPLADTSILMCLVLRPRVPPATSLPADMVAPPAPGVDTRLLVLRPRVSPTVASAFDSPSPTPPPPSRPQVGGLRPLLNPNPTFEEEDGTPVKQEDDATSSSFSLDDFSERVGSVSLDENADVDREDSIMTDTDTDTDTDTVVGVTDRDRSAWDGSSIYSDAATDRTVTPRTSPPPVANSPPIGRPFGTFTAFDLMIMNIEVGPGRPESNVFGYNAPQPGLSPYREAAPHGFAGHDGAEFPDIRCATLRTLSSMDFATPRARSPVDDQATPRASVANRGGEGPSRASRASTVETGVSRASTVDSEFGP